MNFRFSRLRNISYFSRKISGHSIYDPANGNLNYKGSAGLTLTYGDAAHKHAATAYNGGVYAYDANGNMITRNPAGTPSYGFTYDVENHLTSVTGSATASFVGVYPERSLRRDGDGKRVKSVDVYQNLASGAPASGDITLNYADVTTNGDTWADSGASSDREYSYTTSGLHYAQVDLGAVYTIDKVTVWHYAYDGRTYHNTKTQVSSDGTTWYTVFDSATQGEYAETSAGKTHTFTARSVRYIRDYANGNTYNGYNHWVEIQAWGKATTTHIGNYFEWVGSTNTMAKNYYAGGKMVALRKGSTLNFVVSDHLGSTSVTADATTARKVTAQLYYPWGEARDTSGALPTKFQYTGQYSYAADFGLLYYNARFYDPQLSRFAQADTVIPESQGVQAYDRYAYVNNSPMGNTDTSGHCIDASGNVNMGQYPYGTSGMCSAAPTPPTTPSSTSNGETGGNSEPELSQGVGNSTIADIGAPDAPPDFSKPQDNGAPCPPPNIPGLPEDQWEWEYWPGLGNGWKNKADPDGIVWRPDPGKPGKHEGEQPHWHGRRAGQPDILFPPNYQWGRGREQRRSPGPFNPQKGLYEGALAMIAATGTAYLVWQIYPLLPGLPGGRPNLVR